jgi:hypothetical protein
MSYPELENHPDRAELISKALTVSRGKSNGDYLRQCNPLFHAEVAEMVKEIAKAKPKQ